MVTRGWSGSLLVALVIVSSSSPAAWAQDASVYRAYRLGSSVAEVAKEAGLAPEAATVVFEHPSLIQELQWKPSPKRPDGSGPESEAVGSILFDFINGTLYRIVVNYDSEKTEGMTDEDLVEALSVVYGPAHKATAARIITSPAQQVYSDSEAVVARWEDATGSVNLFRGAYRSGLGVVVFSKALAPKARAGIDAAILAAQLDGPRRDLAEQKMRAETERLSHLKARARNKAAFRF